MDSMVGDGTQVGEKSSIKKSVVGAHCVIGKNVKMVGCVITDHVMIGDKYVSFFFHKFVEVNCDFAVPSWRGQLFMRMQGLARMHS
jgi:NDP-sugar pyrophosphorylase family protein